MDNIINQIKSLASGADEAQVKQIIVSLREVSDSLETPLDTIQRLVYLALPLTAIRIGTDLDLDLFQYLVNNKAPATVTELATKTGAAPVLLARILRYLASTGIIKETGKDTFTSNNITEAITFPGASGAFYNYFYTTYPVWQELPGWLKEHKYQDVEDNTNTPLQKAHKTDLPFFSWMLTQPETLAHFNQYMSIRHTGKKQWHEVYPLEDKIQGLAPEQVFFVDVGGGTGTQSRALGKKYHDLKARIIVEDTPDSVAQAVPLPRCREITAKYLGPQAIIGAKMYYLRNILHDFPDEKCITILKNTAAALAPGSVILLDEIVIHDSGAHFHVTQQDIIVMATFAAIERTEEQWYNLAKAAGLKVTNIYLYSTSERDSVIEIVEGVN
uniref:O-methyl transferase B n=1 Tax=Hypocrea virens TaxID=29875 RepID=Q0QBT8_HYPVI|nr:O-methyl transferase B [Trichoderma virens]